MEKCKECQKANSRLTYTQLKNDPIRYEQELDRQRAKSQRWRDRGNKNPSRPSKPFRTRYPEKYAAHSQVNYAKRSGIVLPEPCLHCGDPNTEAHHEDYSKPLDVWWLCRTCHNKADNARRKRLRLTQIPF